MLLVKKSWPPLCPVQLSHAPLAWGLSCLPPSNTRHTPSEPGLDLHASINHRAKTLVIAKTALLPQWELSEIKKFLGQKYMWVLLMGACVGEANVLARLGISWVFCSWALFYRSLLHNRRERVVVSNAAGKKKPKQPVDLTRCGSSHPMHSPFPG